MSVVSLGAYLHRSRSNARRRGVEECRLPPGVIVEIDIERWDVA